MSGKILGFRVAHHHGSCLVEISILLLASTKFCFGNWLLSFGFLRLTCMREEIKRHRNHKHDKFLRKFTS